MDNLSQVQICPHCQTPVDLNDIFCSHCGQALKEIPPSTSLMKQIGLYALSFFLPPLGLWPAIKYLRSQDATAKKIGIICVVLTIFSVVLTIYASVAFFNSFSSQLSKVDLNSLSY